MTEEHGAIYGGYANSARFVLLGPDQSTPGFLPGSTSHRLSSAWRRIPLNLPCKSLSRAESPRVELSRRRPRINTFRTRRRLACVALAPTPDSKPGLADRGPKAEPAPPCDAWPFESSRRRTCAFPDMWRPPRLRCWPWPRYGPSRRRSLHLCASSRTPQIGPHRWPQRRWPATTRRDRLSRTSQSRSSKTAARPIPASGTTFRGRAMCSSSRRPASCSRS